MDDELFENLRSRLKEVDKEEKEIILIGDNNCDFKNNQNANTKKLKMTYSEFQFAQLIIPSFSTQWLLLRQTSKMNRKPQKH